MAAPAKGAPQLRRRARRSEWWPILKLLLRVINESHRGRIQARRVHGRRLMRGVMIAHGVGRGTCERSVRGGVGMHATAPEGHDTDRTNVKVEGGNHRCVAANEAREQTSELVVFILHGFASREKEMKSQRRPSNKTKDRVGVVALDRRVAHEQRQHGAAHRVVSGVNRHHGVARKVGMAQRCGCGWDVWLGTSRQCLPFFAVGKFPFPGSQFFVMKGDMGPPAVTALLPTHMVRRRSSSPRGGRRRGVIGRRSGRWRDDVALVVPFGSRHQMSTTSYQRSMRFFHRRFSTTAWSMP